jgi:SSS family solute:Na+ symporter
MGGVLVMEAWVLPFIITISYTLIAVIMGVRAKGKLDMNKLENWSVTGHTLGTFAMIFLIGAGNVSAYTFMGAPGWGWSYGVPAFYVVVYLCLMAFTAYLFNPRVAKLSEKSKMLSQAEGIGVRYESRFLRALAGFVGAFSLIYLAMVQIIGCGYILNVMSGGNIPLKVGEAIITTAIFIYIFKSGLKAIGWTNVFQGILMFVLSFAVGGSLIYMTTGTLRLTEVFTKVAEASPGHLTLPGALGTMSPVFWSTSILISIVAFWPSYWTAASGGRSVEAVRKTVLFVPAYYLVMVPMIIVGFICVYAFPGYEGAMDKIAITYALQQLPWWVVGLLGAGVLAAAQSSSEMHFHTTTLTLSHDVISPYRKNNTPEKEGKLQRLLLFPVMFLIVLPLAMINPANLVYLYLVAYGFVSQLAPLIFGVFVWPRSTKIGAIAGLIVGVAVVLYCNFVVPNPLGIHAGIWGLAFNIPIHIVVSLITKPAQKKTIEIFFNENITENLYEETA